MGGGERGREIRGKDEEISVNVLSNLYVVY